MNILYRTAATATGGRTGHAATTDGAFSVALVTPKELGGAGGEGANPEQLFASGYAACFLGALKFVAGKRKVKIADDSRVTAAVGIGPRDERLAALLMIDVDGFKPVNDRHGHAVGDRVLGVVAGALRAALQGRDIAGRFGGDEFCMLLVDVSPGEAGHRAERLRAAVAAQPVRVDGIEVPVTLSIGIAHARPGGDVDLDALLATADRRLYLAKRAGRDRVIDRDVEVELPARA